MKRILFSMGLACCVLNGLATNGMEPEDPESAIYDEFALSFWSGVPASNWQRDFRGFVLGLGSGFKSVRGAQVSLCMNDADEMKAGAQIALGYNHADVARNGCQISIVNNANSAALQLGLLCFNKGGFLPFFVFFNFDKTAFGAKRQTL